MSPNPGLNLEDDEDGLETTATPGTTAGASAKPSTTKPATAVDDDDDVEFGDENEYKRPGELERIPQPAKNQFVRFSILAHPTTGKALMKKGYVHYTKDKGYARCLSKRDKKGNFVGAPEFCCKAKPGEARYSVLVVQYTSINPTSGKFLKDTPVVFEIRALPLTRIGFKEISMLAGEDEEGKNIPVTTFDITATPKDDSKGNKYAMVSKKASYTKSPELEALVKTEMKPFIDCEELRRKIGKVVTRAEMKAHIGIDVSGGDDTPGMDDLDD